MGSEALDEERHEDDEAHAHQQHGVPVRLAIVFRFIDGTGSIDLIQLSS